MGYCVFVHYYDNKKNYILTKRNFFDLLYCLKSNKVPFIEKKGGIDIVCNKNINYIFVIDLINYIKRGLYQYE